jgi:peptidase E
VSSRIVALGGGGFSMEPGGLLDDYFLGLTGRDRPRVCFVPTASGDAAQYVVDFYAAFPTTRCYPTHLPLFSRDGRDLRSVVLGSDVVYVGGGNTANMLAIWRVHGLDAVLREAWEAGVVLCGVSAGMLCWFASGVTDSLGTGLARLDDGLGLLPGSACPHYDGEGLRRPRYHQLVAEGLPGGYAADDGVALSFTGTDLTEAVTSRPGRQAYRVEATADGVTETALPTRRL